MLQNQMVCVSIASGFIPIPILFCHTELYLFSVIPGFEAESVNVDFISGLMPPRTPHHISFFYCDTKERNMEKTENNSSLHFSDEKCL